jgi:hypothetical protein
VVSVEEKIQALESCLAPFADEEGRRRDLEKRLQAALNDDPFRGDERA